jgi:hypothetical protein
MQSVWQHAFPLSAVPKAHGLEVRLRAIEQSAFVDPFTDGTTARLKGKETTVFLSTCELEASIPTSTPAGIVFHVARCGSTLISQVLKRGYPVTVYSEPAAINDLLMPPQIWERGRTVKALRRLGDIFARHAGRPYVLKLRSWNSLFCDLVIEAFPTTPWVFCIRDPVAVGVSVIRSPPTWLRTFGSTLNPFLEYTIRRTSRGEREQYIAQMYAAFCYAIAAIDRTRGKIVEYEQLPEAVWDIIGPHFGFECSEREKQTMISAGKLYSKAAIGTKIEFRPDSAAKRASANDQLKRAAYSYAHPALRRLFRTTVSE